MRSGMGILAGCLVVLGGMETSAQDARVTIAAASAARLQDDLEDLIKLGPANLHKQGKTLRDVLEAFFQGMPTDKPLRVDLVFESEQVTQVGVLPIQKLDGRGGLIENIESFGFKVGNPDATGLYTINPVRIQSRSTKTKKASAAPAGPPPKPMFMRVVGPHAVLTTDSKLVPANLGNQALPDGFLPGEADVAAELVNDAQGLAGRQKSFQSLRKQLEAGVEFKRGESQENFQLRKLALEQHLDEAERFITEASHLGFKWTTDTRNARGLGVLALKALPGTSLAESVDLLVQKPSLFANVKFAPKPALQLRVNFAVDDMRSEHAKEFYAALLPVMQQAMDTRPNLTAAGKTAAKDALSQLFAMLNASVPLKVLDTIIDVHATSDGKHGLICAIRTADGTKATALVKQLPKIRDGWKVDENVGEHGGVTIHSVTIAPHRLDEFQAVIGGEPKMLIGVSKDAVWGAAGEGALAKLKAAIDEAAQPAPSKAAPEFLTLEMRFDPWVRLLDVLRSHEPAPANPTKADQEAEKQRNKIRKYALGAFGSGDDFLKATLLRDGDEVQGTLEILPGVLRFLGTAVGDFTAENLN